jgi:hypothetical protein
VAAGGDAIFGVTKFSDLTAAEFALQYKGYKRDPSFSPPADVPVVSCWAATLLVYHDPCPARSDVDVAARSAHDCRVAACGTCGAG